METLMLNNSVINTFKKKMIMLLVIAVMAIPAAIAGTHDSTPGDEKVTVKCLRVEDGQVYFSVKFDNASGAKFDVLINDESGENLYHGVFSEAKFSKVFKAPSEHGKLTVVIRNARGKEYHKFEITSEARYVQQAIVKRM